MGELLKDIGNVDISLTMSFLVFALLFIGFWEKKYLLELEIAVRHDVLGQRKKCQKYLYRLGCARFICALFAAFFYLIGAGFVVAGIIFSYG